MVLLVIAHIWKFALFLNKTDNTPVIGTPVLFDDRKHTKNQQTCKLRVQQNRHIKPHTLSQLKLSITIYQLQYE
jgi:hypothetical protein